MTNSSGTFKLLILTMVASLGCAETVDTRLRIDYPYSIYGVMNPKSDTQAVRVFEIKSEIRLVQPEPIDAIVTTLEIESGAHRIWRDSIIQLADGDYRHVYWSLFQPQSGESYLLKTERSDGEAASAQTTIPPYVTLEVLEPDTLRPREALMPVMIHGSPPSMPRIEVEYILAGYRAEGGETFFKPVQFNYVGRPREVDGGALLEIDLIADYSDIYQLFRDDSNVSAEIIDLKEIQVRIHVADGNWVSPVGIFDPNLLVEPGTFSNVENGFGFFGSGYVEATVFRPPVVLLRRAGFYIIGETG